MRLQVVHFGTLFTGGRSWSCLSSCGHCLSTYCLESGTHHTAAHGCSGVFACLPIARDATGTSKAALRLDAIKGAMKALLPSAAPAPCPEARQLQLRRSGTRSCWQTTTTGTRTRSMTWSGAVWIPPRGMTGSSGGLCTSWTSTTCQPAREKGRCLLEGVSVQGPSTCLRLIWPQHQAGCGL